MLWFTLLLVTLLLLFTTRQGTCSVTKAPLTMRYADHARLGVRWWLEGRAVGEGRWYADHRATLDDICAGQRARCVRDGAHHDSAAMVLT